MARSKKKYYRVTGDENAIEISVWYAEGGHNYFTSQADRRGFFLSATPCTLSKGDYYRSVATQMFKGFKMLLKETTRFSQKTLDAYSVTDALAKEMFYKACEQYNLTPVYNESGELVIED